MKVCVDCIYHQEVPYSYHQCHHEDNLKINPVDGFRSLKKGCTDLNKGDCKFFEKIKFEKINKKFLWWRWNKLVATNLVRQKLSYREDGYDTCDFGI